jgi:hypothetical protein
VTSKFAMEELQWFLARWRQGNSCVSLMPLFLGLTVEECEGLRELYNDSKIWEGRERPAEGDLDAWAEAISQLCTCIGVKPETVSLHAVS